MCWSVSIYFVNLAVGGREEGGWWYKYGDPVSCDAAVHTRIFKESEMDAAMDYARSLAPVVAEMNGGRRPLHSAACEGVYECLVHEGLPAPFPEERPIYE